MTIEDGLQHLGYALLVAAVLAPRRVWMRAAIAAGALLLLTHAAFVTGDRATAVWMAALSLAATFLMAGALWRHGRVRFSPEEEALRRRFLSSLDRHQARHLLNQGYWLDGEAGDLLTREGEPVAQLYYLSEGEAKVTIAGRAIGLCRTGDLVGELTVLSAEPATATVALTRYSRFWCAPAERLRPYLEAHDEVRLAMERGFAVSLTAKLRASNEALAAVPLAQAI